MFWKKEKPPTDILVHESEDQRQSFRYEFGDSEGFNMAFKGRTVRVINISAGGMAFRNQGFNQFDFDFVKFQLDIPDFTGDTTFFAGLRILRVSSRDTCHCIFEQCSLDQHELIHKYVLEMQKKDLARRS